MKSDIFVNLPVKDLLKSIDFYKSLGFGINEQFTDRKTAACVVIGDNIHVMLLTHDKFKQFTPKTICDATKSNEVLLCTSRESRQHVDETVAKAVAAGGSTYSEPQDHGFQDPDGHIWELIHMVDASAVTHG